MKYKWEKTNILTIEQEKVLTFYKGCKMGINEVAKKW